MSAARHPDDPGLSKTERARLIEETLTVYSEALTTEVRRLAGREAAPDPSAILAGIRERRARVVAANLNADAFNDAYAAMVRLAREDSALLLAAVEAVLKLADEWETKGGRLYGFDDRASRTFDECAEGLREAITSALTGKEGNEDG